MTAEQIETLSEILAIFFHRRDMLDMFEDTDVLSTIIDGSERDKLWMIAIYNDHKAVGVRKAINDNEKNKTRLAAKLAKLEE